MRLTRCFLELADASKKDDHIGCLMLLKLPSGWRVRGEFRGARPLGGAGDDVSCASIDGCGCQCRSSAALGCKYETGVESSSRDPARPSCYTFLSLSQSIPTEPLASGVLEISLETSRQEPWKGRSGRATPGRKDGVRVAPSGCICFWF